MRSPRRDQRSAASSTDTAADYYRSGTRIDALRSATSGYRCPPAAVLGQQGIKASSSQDGISDSDEKLAYSAADIRRKGVELAVLPSADDIVRACLDAIPVGLNEVAMLADRRDLGGLDRTQMRHSRQAKNLVSAAQWHLDEVLDTHLAAQLREWIDIKLRLV